jgi:predicted DNA-binding transcriptional regulator AlpA
MAIAFNVTPSRHFVSADLGLWTSGQVRAYFGGVSAMWIPRRMQADPTFPKPTKIGRRNFWRVEAIKQWVDQQEAATRLSELSNKVMS